MVRLMRDADFRAEQLNGLRAGHIAPITDLVDHLRNSGQGLWAPYVAPMYGGIHARLLSVLRDPGPKTNVDRGGSGFLSMENDDATAERISGLFAEAGIEASEIVPWNAYPWYQRLSDGGAAGGRRAAAHGSDCPVAAAEGCDASRRFSSGRVATAVPPASVYRWASDSHRDLPHQSTGILASRSCCPSSAR